jgi:hypothetical protein
MSFRSNIYKWNSGIVLAAILYLVQSGVYTSGYTGIKEKPTISVYGLKSIGISQSLAASLQEHLESNLLEYEQYDVMSRNNIDLILKENRFQQTGICPEEECLIEAGHILGVEKIITGTISMVGSTYNVVLKMIDVETAKLESSVSKKHAGSVDTLLDVIEVTLKTLIGENRKFAKEKEVQKERELTEEAYKEKIGKLQRELKELRNRTTELRSNWEEEKNNVTLLQYLHREQEEKIRELEEMPYDQELHKQAQIGDDSVVQVAAVSGTLIAATDGYHDNNKTKRTAESNKGKKIGIGAIVVLVIVAVSVLVFQLTGADK